MADLMDSRQLFPQPRRRRGLAAMLLLLSTSVGVSSVPAQPLSLTGSGSVQNAAASMRPAAERIGAYSPLTQARLVAEGTQLNPLPSEIPDIDPLAVTPAMAAFIAGKIDSNMQREARLRKLQESIFDTEDGLGIVYGTYGTFTAAETFERATGNCLSFTLLFVSLARHLGFVAHFVEVDEVTGWSRQGDVSFNHWHMFAEVELSNGIVQVDFLPWAERRYRARSRIDENRMRAHFYNNVGAQKLTSEGSSAGATAYFHKALDLDPTFTPAKLNLAVAQRRAGRTDQAEANLLGILETEPRSSQAVTNLANLYASVGRDQEASRWLKRRDRFLKQNPFHHFRLGLLALQTDDAAEARTHFRRAISRQVDEAMFHQHLAEAYFRLGQRSRARSSLEQALEYSVEPERKLVIERALAKLESRPGNG